MARKRKLIVSVSARVLRHLSRGIYRSPAGALKELVSNAYDAGATEASIDTSWPTFKSITITDNGSGMTDKAFESFVGNIGFSEKSAGDTIRVQSTGAKRTVVGHYGIGLLAIGQLAAKMEITSKLRGSRHGFRAELDFEQFDVKQREGIKRSTIKDERQLEQEDAKAKKKSFDIGRGWITGLRYPSKARNKHFTKVTLTAVRDVVRQKITGAFRGLNPDGEKVQQYSGRYETLLDLLTKQEKLATQGLYPYEKLVWELGVYCPVPYPTVGEFARGGELEDIASLADRYDFTLRVDGLLVQKPFSRSFFDDPEYPVEKVFLWRNQPYTAKRRGPRVSGYLIYKRRIRPKSMQGVLIREGGVGVGGYDTTYLEYPFNEGQKFTQLTGEIFAEGLSGALNIDRDSFNEIDDRYLALGAWLHKNLRKTVFPDIKRLQKEAGSPKRKENMADLEQTLVAFGKRSGRAPKVQFAELGKDKPLLSLRGRTLTINTDHPDGSGSSAKLEKVRLAAALVLNGLVTPAAIQAIEAELKEARRATRRKK